MCKKRSFSNCANEIERDRESVLDGESGCMNGYVRERVDKDFEREREREM